MKRTGHNPILAATRRFAVAERGAVLVEFALVFPLMLLFFAIMFESARTFWTYQIAISGVRDAARYVARVAPVGICNVAGGNLDGYTTKATEIVRDDMAGSGMFPTTVVLNSVTLSHSCVTGTYRTSPAPVASVNASLTVQFPMGFLFGWFGDELVTITRTVQDESRIIGQ
jgi:Flp pilus assembly protein TadG